MFFAKDFPGTFRNEFSECVLVYEILNEIYSNNDVVRITGNEFKGAKLDRETYYYIRGDNQIILFESKDFFIKGDIKLSYDFKRIEAELKNNRLEKAVKQLERNIRRVITKQLILDNDYDVTEIEIYPVIIVHDSLYSASALNYWIHYWLQDAISKMKEEKEFLKFDLEKIKPLTLIEIDTLILFVSQLKEGKLNIIDLIDNYQQYVDYGRINFKSIEEIEIYAYQSAIPFSEFVRD